MTSLTAGAPRAGRREWIAFSVLMLPLLLVSMDVSVLYFAVPAISRELDPTGTQQLWIFDIYGFALAGLLITMGSLGDRIGRRRLLMLGAAAFGLASLGAAYAQSAEMLIAARALLGIGGATLMPSTMALTRHLFQDPKQRTAAIGIWSGAMAGGVALGSVLCGVMLRHFWWGSVFLINTPVMVLLLILAPVLLPESRNPEPGRFDLLGVPLSMGAVLPVIYGVKELAADGYAPLPALCLTAGLLLGAAFVHRQRTHPNPMVSPELFRGRGFGSAVGINLLASFAMMGSSLFTTQYLQSVLGKGPLEAALWSLVPSVSVGVAGPTAAALGQRINRAYVIAGGFLTAAVGFALLAFTGTHSLTLVLVGAAVLASGIVTVMALITDMALSTAPAERAGAASSLLETGQELGGALGMALLGCIGTAVYRRDMADAVPTGLPSATADSVRETLGHAALVAGRLPGRAGQALLDDAREAFTHGMRIASLAGVVVLLAGAVLAAVALRRIPAAVPGAGPADGAGAVDPVASADGAGAATPANAAYGADPAEPTYGPSAADPTGPADGAGAAAPTHPTAPAGGPAMGTAPRRTGPVHLSG
ncbi:MFS transporter [Streptomyces palmae]|uniref:MFS transporter n=1 Tax=Streptomyces palmae TaxID=1701085 RepID=A0A4Z0H7S5_9ACTN|nr:MFS transporter [Streptomyces palmae]TGB07143.1 MFS transporter [Streptomyces palmae]